MYYSLTKSLFILLHQIHVAGPVITITWLCPTHSLMKNLFASHKSCDWSAIVAVISVGLRDVEEDQGLWRKCLTSVESRGGAL